jgi:transcriptional regulator with XRE-family HTH domain
MTPVKQGKYEFKKESLIDVRKKMGLSQVKMAEALNVPANTLSRWEIGTTVPDAKNLAGFYSLAKEHGIIPTFFELRGNFVPFKYNFIVLWDFQTTGTQAFWVQNAHNTIMAEIGKRFTGVVPIYKAFTHFSQDAAADILDKLNWTVFSGEDEIFTDIVNQAKSDCGHNPEGTVLVLITLDDDFTEVIDELIHIGVRVFVMSPNIYNNKLIQKVGQANSIPWFSVSLEQPKRQLKTQNPSWGWNLPTIQ